MEQRISVVINTLNEEKNIGKVIRFLGWADEIIICDMHSEDKTVEIAKKLGAKIFSYKREQYVEPARNFAISKAINEWILILDADEEIDGTLANKLKKIAEKMHQIDYVRLPRKNVIFGKWIKHTGWWPDYNIRFFKKGKVKWIDKIHRPPEASGLGFNLPENEEDAIVHHSYKNVSQFLERMNRYTTIQAIGLKNEGYKFNWNDLFEKPLNEFLSRLFALEGYKDGLHGLVLSFLQAFSFLIVYLKLWEMDKFKEQEITLAEVQNHKDQSAKALDYWFKQSKREVNFLEKLFKKK